LPRGGGRGSRGRRRHGGAYLRVGKGGLRIAGSIFGTLQADRLAKALAGTDGAILCRRGPRKLRRQVNPGLWAN
jgi:hypothetical protein